MSESCRQTPDLELKSPFNDSTSICDSTKLCACPFCRLETKDDHWKSQQVRALVWALFKATVIVLAFAGLVLWATMFWLLMKP